MPSFGTLATKFPEAASETTPRLRDYNGQTVTIVDAKVITRKVNDNKDVDEPFVFLSGGVKVQATNAVVKQCDRLFKLLDGAVQKGDRTALEEMGIPKSVDLAKRESWRFLDCKVEALDRGVKIS